MKLGDFESQQATDEVGRLLLPIIFGMGVSVETAKKWFETKFGRDGMKKAVEAMEQNEHARVVYQYIMIRQCPGKLPAEPDLLLHEFHKFVKVPEKGSKTNKSLKPNDDFPYSMYIALTCCNPTIEVFGKDHGKLKTLPVGEFPTQTVKELEENVKFANEKSKFDLDILTAQNIPLQFHAQYALTYKENAVLNDPANQDTVAAAYLVKEAATIDSNTGVKINLEKSGINETSLVAYVTAKYYGARKRSRPEDGDPPDARAAPATGGAPGGSGTGEKPSIKDYIKAHENRRDPDATPFGQLTKVAEGLYDSKLTKKQKDGIRMQYNWYVEVEKNSGGVLVQSCKNLDAKKTVEDIKGKFNGFAENLKAPTFMQGFVDYMMDK